MSSSSTDAVSLAKRVASVSDSFGWLVLAALRFHSAPCSWPAEGLTASSDKLAITRDPVLICYPVGYYGLSGSGLG